MVIINGHTTIFRTLQLTENYTTNLAKHPRKLAESIQKVSVEILPIFKQDLTRARRFVILSIGKSRFYGQQGQL